MSMNIPGIAHVQWTMRQWLGQIGLQTLALRGALTLIVLLMASALLNVSSELSALELAVQQEEARAQALKRGPAVPQHGQALARFHNFFEPENGLSAILKSLHELALTQGLTFSQGDYKRSVFGMTSQDGPEFRLVQYEITLPVKGSYLDIRKYVANILATHSGLAVSGLNFTRESDIAQTIHANLHLVLYLRTAELP